MIILFTPSYNTAERCVFYAPNWKDEVGDINYSSINYMAGFVDTTFFLGSEGTEYTTKINYIVDVQRGTSQRRIKYIKMTFDDLPSCF